MTEFSIVFWFNFKKVYPDDHKTHTVENVKSQVVAFLNRYPFKNFRIRVQNFKEGANDIYKGFDHEEIDNQFMMRPYGGFKIGCKIRHHERCETGNNTIVILPSTSYGINKYSLAEKNTGMLDYDGKEIFVRGYELADLDYTVFNNFRGYVSDLDPAIVHRIVDWEISYIINQMGYKEVANKSTGPNGHFGMLYENNNGTSTNEYHIEVQQSLNNGTWFIYYTKI